MSAVEAPPFIRTIEWDMMDKNKFFPLSMLSSFSIRCCLYPLTVIKTRLQIQRRNHMYTGKWKKPFVFPPHQSFPLNFVFFPLLTYSFEKSLSSIFSMIPSSPGMIDAYRKIHRTEGFSGLYRGFWISSVQIISGVFYVSTYEGVRHLLGQNPFTADLDSRTKALIGGGAASTVGQTIIVPFDVLSQHLMVLGVSSKHGKLAFDKVYYYFFKHLFI